MDKNKENIKWQPISFLSQIANMIDGMLDAAKGTYGPLCQIEVHDDFTIKRIFGVTGQQVDNEWMLFDVITAVEFYMRDQFDYDENVYQIEELDLRLEKKNMRNRKISLRD